MPKEIDEREQSVKAASAVDPSFVLSTFSDVSGLFGQNVKVQIKDLDALTNTPGTVVLTNLQVEAKTVDAAVAVALKLTDQFSQSSGFGAGSKAEFVPDPGVKSTSSGIQTVTLIQHIRGIPIFMVARKVNLFPDRVEMAGGQALILESQVPTAPAVQAEVALMVAAREVTAPDPQPQLDPITKQPMVLPQVDLSQFQPRIIAGFNLPSLPTVYDQGPFDAPITANLLIFSPDKLGRPRLCWEFRIALPQGADPYRVIVAADDPQNLEVLYLKSMSHQASGPAGPSSWARTPNIPPPQAPPMPPPQAAGFANAPIAALAAAARGPTPSARGNVYETSPKWPRGFINFPRPASDYPSFRPGLSLPAQPWVNAPATAGAPPQTDGNNVVGVTDYTSKTAAGKNTAGGFEFDPIDGAFSGDQEVLNIFYFCNYMHDFFYMLGFDDASGAFSGATRVTARADPGPVYGVANMRTFARQPPEMNMGLVRQDPSGTVFHTAFDADVVFHEFVHGVSNRLIGGNLRDDALSLPQPYGMGEGWSDYFALTVQNYGQPVERTVTGDWVTGRPGGIRNFPYDQNYPLDLRDLGTSVNSLRNGRAVNPPINMSEQHNVGEVWCATLMHAQRLVGRTLGDPKLRRELCWQVVVDAFKIMPSNPTFIQARDATLAALDALAKAQPGLLPRATTTPAGGRCGPRSPASAWAPAPARRAPTSATPSPPTSTSPPTSAARSSTAPRRTCPR